MKCALYISTYVLARYIGFSDYLQLTRQTINLSPTSPHTYSWIQESGASIDAHPVKLVKIRGDMAAGTFVACMHPYKLGNPLGCCRIVQMPAQPPTVTHMPEGTVGASEAIIGSDVQDIRTICFKAAMVHGQHSTSSNALETNMSSNQTIATTYWNAHGLVSRIYYPRNSRCILRMNQLQRPA